MRFSPDIPIEWFNVYQNSALLCLTYFLTAYCNILKKLFWFSLETEGVYMSDTYTYFKAFKPYPLSFCFVFHTHMRMLLAVVYLLALQHCLFPNMLLCFS